MRLSLWDAIKVSSLCLQHIYYIYTHTHTHTVTHTHTEESHIMHKSKDVFVGTRWWCSQSWNHCVFFYLASAIKGVIELLLLFFWLGCKLNVKVYSSGFSHCHNKLQMCWHCWLFILLVSPWHNSRGWLGFRNQSVILSYCSQLLTCHWLTVNCWHCTLLTVTVKQHLNYWSTSSHQVVVSAQDSEFEDCWFQTCLLISFGSLLYA